MVKEVAISLHFTVRIVMSSLMAGFMWQTVLVCWESLWNIQWRRIPSCRKW